MFKQFSYSIPDTLDPCGQTKISKQFDSNINLNVTDELCLGSLSHAMLKRIAVSSIVSIFAKHGPFYAISSQRVPAHPLRMALPPSRPRSCPLWLFFFLPNRIKARLVLGQKIWNYHTHTAISLLPPKAFELKLSNNSLVCRSWCKTMPQHDGSLNIPIAFSLRCPNTKPSRWVIDAFPPAANNRHRLRTQQVQWRCASWLAETFANCQLAPCCPTCTAATATLFAQNHTHTHTHIPPIGSKPKPGPVTESAPCGE